MGMDLYTVHRPRRSKKNPRPKSPYYRFNFSGWSRLGDWLEEIECPTDWMAGSNDGDICDDDTCMTVANCIEKAYESGKYSTEFHYLEDRKTYSHFETWNFETKKKKLVEVNYKKRIVTFLHKNYPGCLRRVLKAPNIDLPILLAEHEAIKYNNHLNKDHVELQVIKMRLKGQPVDLTKLIDLDACDNQRKGKETTWSTLGYYLGFADFCRECAGLGGFRQC